MKYIKYSKNFREQEAFEFHNKYFGKHLFIINSVEHYIMLRPIIMMFSRSKIKLLFRNGITMEIINKFIRSQYDKKRYLEGRIVDDKPETIEAKIYSKKGYIYSGVKIISSKSARAFRNHKPTMYRK